MTATTITPPRHILVGGHKIRLRGVQTLAWIGIGGFAAILAVSGFYYALTQVHWYYLPGHTLFYLKPGWDHLFAQAWWPEVRHGIRNLGEGVAALPLLKWVAGNWRKYAGRQVSDWQIPVRLAATILVGMGLIIAAMWVVTFGYPMAAHHSVHVHYVTPEARTAEYELFVIGLLIGQVTSRIWHPAACAIQLFFTEQAVTWWESHNLMPPWIRLPLTPPAMRERVSWMFGESIPAQKHGTWVRWLLPLAAVVFIGLVGAGVYARYFAA